MSNKYVFKNYNHLEVFSFMLITINYLNVL